MGSTVGADVGAVVHEPSRVGACEMEGSILTGGYFGAYRSAGIAGRSGCVEPVGALTGGRSRSIGTVQPGSVDINAGATSVGSTTNQEVSGHAG